MSDGRRRACGRGSRRGFGRSGDRGERGASLVEAAIVFPLVILLTMGVLEFGIAFQRQAAVKTASRAGARVASALPRNDLFDDEAAKAVSTQLAGTGELSPSELWIYQAGSDDDPVGGCPGARCNVWTWSDASHKFVFESGSWSAADQNACVDGNPNHPDRIGVFVSADHRFLTGMFGRTVTMTGKTVMRLEPFAGGPCHG